MTKTFPSHLDPNNFGIDEFEDPYDAFFWLGYFAGRKSATPPAVLTKVEEQTFPRPMTGVPFCELAEFCVFDTETSGLSASACAVQVAVGFFRADGSAMGYYNKLWQLPAGVHLSASSVNVHGITKRRLQQEGMDAFVEIRAVHRMFDTMKRRGKRIVAHNARFDVRILKQTARKHKFGGWSIEAADVFCTMQNSKHRCGIVSQKTGRLKNPSNSELYQKLSGEAPQGALHDAIVDIKVTGRSFFLGSQRGWWSM